MSLWQGIGKQGILHKEGSKTSDWKSRFFRLVEDGLLYYETEAPTEKVNYITHLHALGQKHQGMFLT